MDDITLLEECVIKSEEMEEEVEENTENMDYDRLGNVSVKTEYTTYETPINEQNYLEEDDAAPPLVGVLLQPKEEVEEGTEQQEAKTKYSVCAAEEHSDSEEEEVKPPVAVFIKMEMEEGTEEQEDPLALSDDTGANDLGERDTQIQIPGPTRKTRWNCLRDQLRKALKKKIIKSGQAANIAKKWKYEDHMAFLVPYFKERDTTSNIGDLKSAGEESIDAVEASEDCVDKLLSTNSPDIVEENGPQSTSVRQTIRPRTRAMSSPPKMPAPSCNKVRTSYNKANKRKTASSVLMEYLINSEKHISSNDDPIDLFFNGLVATVKTFSPEYQHLAKSRLFAVVSDLEWAQLQDKTNSNQNLQATKVQTMERATETVVSTPQHSSPNSVASTSSFYENYNSESYSEQKNGEQIS